MMCGTGFLALCHVAAFAMTRSLKYEKRTAASFLQWHAIEYETMRDGEAGRKTSHSICNESLSEGGVLSSAYIEQMRYLGFRILNTSVEGDSLYQRETTEP
jgi:hypothetical protein